MPTHQASMKVSRFMQYGNHLFPLSSSCAWAAPKLVSRTTNVVTSNPVRRAAIWAAPTSLFFPATVEPPAPSGSNNPLNGTYFVDEIMTAKRRHLGEHPAIKAPPRGLSGASGRQHDLPEERKRSIAHRRGTRNPDHRTGVD